MVTGTWLPPFGEPNAGAHTLVVVFDGSDIHRHAVVECDYVFGLAFFDDVIVVASVSLGILVED